MTLDIHTAVMAAIAITALWTIYNIWAGTRSIRKARTLKFFRMRRDRMVSGWRMLFFALIGILLILVLNKFAEPVIYSFYPPVPTQTLTPTITHTPTISLTPTITLTPSVTNTPSVSDTPTITPTPHIPLVIEIQFTSVTTPNPDAIFSPIQFAQALDENFQPVNPALVFQNPVGHLYAQFSYDQMIVGSQWTAIWYFGSEIVHYETAPWDGQTGGYGYTDWEPEPGMWLPGEYEVQLFVGYIWKQSGRFTVEGEPPILPSATATTSPTPTISVTPTPQPSTSPTVTLTRRPTDTPQPTATRRPTDTRQPSPTYTPRPPTFTPGPSLTNTYAPTLTTAPPTITRTNAPTLTPAPPTITNTNAPTATSGTSTP